MRLRERSDIMLLGLYAVLIAALMILAVSGANIYDRVLSSSARHEKVRSALAFIQNQTAASPGGITLRDGILCLPEPGGEYETRIFEKDGSLWAAFCRADTAMSCVEGQSICEVADFALSLESEKLLRVEADGAAAYVYCAGGGSDG